MTQDIHWQKYASRFKTFPTHLEPADTDPAMIVCIPVLAEPDLIVTLDSLWLCDRPPVPMEIILLFNKNQKMSSEEIALHDQSWEDCQHWVEQHAAPDFLFKPIYIETMPDPSGGVGWARKLVLDEAARRLSQTGIMLCLDSDCTVQKNYLTVVYNYFKMDSNCNAASISFEHLLDELGPKVRQRIIQYELHLRYLVHAMRWTGHPFAFQTIGSSMAVRRSAYLEQGGMNTRQAGEDFYFLQKFIEVGSLHEIKGTCVYPSPRISDRVPFGTGRAMQTLALDDSHWMTTAFDTFRIIKPLFLNIERLKNIVQEREQIEPYDQLQALGLHVVLLNFLKQIDFISQCIVIEKYTINQTSFKKRFFRFFNAFMMIRYMHYMRDHLCPDVAVASAVKEFIIELDPQVTTVDHAEGYLRYFRKRDNGD